MTCLSSYHWNLSVLHISTGNTIWTGILYESVGPCRLKLCFSCWWVSVVRLMRQKKSHKEKSTYSVFDNASMIGWAGSRGRSNRPWNCLPPSAPRGRRGAITPTDQVAGAGRARRVRLSNRGIVDRIRRSERALAVRRTPGRGPTTAWPWPRLHPAGIGADN